MNEPLSLSTKAPILAAAILLALVVYAAIIVNWDSQFDEQSEDTVANESSFPGEMGYFNPPSAMADVCFKKYEFLVYINDNVVRTKDELVSFVSKLDNNGQLNVTSEDLVPEADYFFQISGPVQKADINSERCGKGYFKLTSTSD